ncbi:hypothetical protein ACLH30_003250 [Edwardsiella piscicida]
MMSDLFDFIVKYSGAFSVVFSAIVTVSTIVYSCLTYKLFAETKKMRMVQTEPKIEITIKSADIAIHMVRLHVKNIGLGPAINVKFNPKVIRGGEVAQSLLDELTMINFFNTGFNYFGPSQERYSSYADMTTGYDGKIESVLAFDISYESTTGVKYQESSTIDMSELKGAYRLGTPNLYSIAKSIEKIQHDVSHITSGSKKIGVQIYTAKDRRKEQEKHRELIKNTVKK